MPKQYNYTEKTGRPTKYDPAMVDEVDKYLETLNTNELPMMAGLALYLNVNKDTLVEWGKVYPEFSVALKKLMTKQELQLVNDGIYGGKEVNPTIVKLLLQNNHGMRERTDVTSDDEKIVYPNVQNIFESATGRINRIHDKCTTFLYANDI